MASEADPSAETSMVLVVGGTGALGAAVAKLLTKRGLATVATYSGAPPDPGLVPGTRWVRFDAAAPDTAANITAAVAAAGLPLTCVVYAAGIPSSRLPLAATPLAELAELFSVNAQGLVAMWQSVAPVARRSGTSLVVISSQAARTLSAGSGPYSASKAALEALALTLAEEEAAHDVRVNVIAPSLISSPMADRISARTRGNHLPWGKALELAEVAEAAVALGCDSTWRYLSGQVLQLDAPITPSPDAVEVP
ncbi:SDR family oxidoreductase [Streptomyces sp. NPDC102381]|uniref:SDR family oxidoreductase n=1 Tax=Streptomyces sp. NPDC102381 TaxID=3366164 RepID=UPI003827A4C6